MRLLGRFVAFVAPIVLGLSGIALAAEGVIVNVRQEPIEGARVCVVDATADLLCVLTDAGGRFELPVARIDTLRADAEGYNPTSFSASAQQGPVTLKRAPVLSVRVIDGATGEGVAEGEILISYPTGKEVGPFPFNRSGVLIRRGLEPGAIRVVGRAEGFRRSGPVSATLRPGEKTTVKVELTPAEARDQSE